MYPTRQTTRELNQQQSKPTSGKDKKKKKNSGVPAANLLLTGPLAPLMEQRTFFKNKEDAPQAKDGSLAMLKQWFEALSVQDRVNSLTTSYPLLAHNIIHINCRHVRGHGPLCQFSLKREKQPEENFGMPRRYPKPNANEELIFEVVNPQQSYQSYSPYSKGRQIRETQTRLIKLTRVTGNKTEKDTVTVDTELVKSVDTFFELMSEVTDGKAFSQPAQYVTRPGAAGKPLIESPRWLARDGAYYLGVWIAAILEETLWAHFNYSN